MTDQLKKITDSLKELEGLGYFQFHLMDKNHLRDDREVERVKVDKWNFKVQLTITEIDSLETIASNIALCYTKCQEMEKTYLYKLNNPDLYESLTAWNQQRK